jgi:hypothetical protein
MKPELISEGAVDSRERIDPKTNSSSKCKCTFFNAT